MARLLRTDPAGQQPQAGPMPTPDPSAPESGGRIGWSELGREFDRLRPQLQSVAKRVTRDADAAEDVVQLAFEKAFRRRDQFRGDARLSTWLHRIVVNEALMWLRTRRRQAGRWAPEQGSEVEAVDPGPGPEETLLAREARRRVAEGLASLAPVDRDVLIACSVDQRSQRDVARDLGLRPGAVKSRAFRARHRLAARLREPEFGQRPGRERTRPRPAS